MILKFKNIQKWLKSCDVSKLLLVTSKSVYKDNFVRLGLDQALVNCEVVHVKDFQINPSVSDLKKMISLLGDQSGFDAILAVGGGSVIDMSKLIKGFLYTPHLVEAVLQDNSKIEPVDIPFGVLPTTAGSGSEGTHFAVIYQEKTKYSIAAPSLKPSKVFLDPSIVIRAPKVVRAASGMDALCQGIESYWSIYSTEESRQFAAEAIDLVWRSLEASVNEDCLEATGNMVKASYLAGQAINITKTTAPHAVSYAFTSFFGVPHGEAVGLLLPRFLEFNSQVEECDCLDSRGVAYVKNTIKEIIEILNADVVTEAVEKIYLLQKSIGLRTRGSEVKMHTSSDRKIIVKNGFNPQRVNNNPRRLKEDSLFCILESMN